MTSYAGEIGQPGIQNALREIIQEIEQEVGGEAAENDVTNPAGEAQPKVGEHSECGMDWINPLDS